MEQSKLGVTERRDSEAEREAYLEALSEKLVREASKVKIVRSSREVVNSLDEVSVSGKQWREGMLADLASTPSRGET